MKAPQPATLDEAIRLASFIRRVDTDFPTGDMWSPELAQDAWNANTFQSMVDNDWDRIWSDEQCQLIMTAWVAYRISR